MSVEILGNVERLPEYVPGKSGVGVDAVKLSSNENPYEPLAEVVAAGAAALRAENRYPQMYADDLCADLAARHGLAPENVVVGNGSVALLNHALAAVAGAGDQVVMPWRSFEAYPIVVGATQAEALAVPLVADTFEHDLAAMARAVRTERVKAVLLCSPNNPTGSALSETAVRGFLDEIPDTVLVILDEAYIQFATMVDVVDGLRLLNDYPNLVVARTFSKAYQLAGLRVGWIAGANQHLMNAIRKVSTPFGVNIAAAAAAREALRHEAEVRTQVEAIVAERERIVTALRADGWQIPDTQGNFYWIPGSHLVKPVTQALAVAQVTARPFPEGVRITVGLPADNDRVLEALATVPRSLF